MMKLEFWAALVADCPKIVPFDYQEDSRSVPQQAANIGLCFKALQPLWQQNWLLSGPRLRGWSFIDRYRSCLYPSEIHGALWSSVILSTWPFKSPPPNLPVPELALSSFSKTLPTWRLESFGYWASLLLAVVSVCLRCYLPLLILLRIYDVLLLEGTCKTLM